MDRIDLKMFIILHKKSWFNFCIQFQPTVSNPLSNDTDSDQWNDGAEFNYWKSKGFTDTKAAESCKTPDVDADSITDHQEVHGYTVKIIASWENDNNPVCIGSSIFSFEQQEPVMNVHMVT
ncbi:MAG: hypothetical protein N3F63_00855 [Thermoplasmata archaeon]|nr:hypothetical protein [Thermoplasmata archaeon]